jgi:hypothetical protein
MVMAKKEGGAGPKFLLLDYLAFETSPAFRPGPLDALNDLRVVVDDVVVGRHVAGA